MVTSESQFFRLVQDAQRFILSYRGILENAPLQAYTSALIFSPVHSLTRELFKDQEPDWIATKPVVEANWGDCLQTLEGHSREVWSVAFSHDGKQVASASGDGTVKIWNASSGDCLKTLEGHSGEVWSVAFSHNGKQVASASDDRTVKIWNASSGECLKSLKVGYQASNISFNIAGSCLLTNEGIISLDISPASNTALATTIFEEPRHHDYGLSAEGAWITWNDRNVLWLPSDYRPLCSVVAPWIIVIGCYSGRVLIIKFSSDKFPLSYH